MSLITQIIAMFAIIALVSAQSPAQPSTVQLNANPVPPVVATNGPVVVADPPIITTTQKPVSSTPVPTPVPTPAPTPLPVPKPESWNGTVMTGNHTCIKVKFSVQIVVKYNNTKGAELEAGFTIPANATIDTTKSYCSDNTKPLEVLAVGFSNVYNTSASLVLTFNRTADNNTAFVEDMSLTFNLTEALFPQFPNASLYNKPVTASAYGLTLFKVASDHSYTCASAQSQILTSQQFQGLDIQIDFMSSRVEAYMKNGTKDWDTEMDCKSAEISDVVPIAVGAALAGLVVIVLIAYFIGRRRSRRLAYQSV